MRIALCAGALASLAACSIPERRPGATDAPPAPREFRAAWVATVANIDWPSRPGLPVARQQEEIRRIVGRATELRLNALIVQVRPAADALYASELEPWSEYLTGEQGRAPEPFYDPLLTWVEEAHARGIELHAWFNPYRARHPTARSALAPSHVANTAPQLVKSYGTHLWMDPGEPESARRTLAVILDVVRRYDIDGVHIDDYFYPYPATAPAPPGEAGPEIDFPDDPSWDAYRHGGGSLGRADWRRQNVNALIERIHDAVHREKSGMKFGISPFGLGRPDRRPPGIAGFSQYDKLHADVELWVAKGWLDYLAPQLYWPIDRTPQAFGVLLDYWARGNPLDRHIWPGLFTSRIDHTPASWPASEIVNQVALARANGGVGGHIHFSMASLLENRKGIADRLKDAQYAEAALVPATPWLGATAPAAPRVDARRVARDSGTLLVEMTQAPGEAPWLYAVWTRHGADWRFHVHPAGRAALRIEPDSRARPADGVVVSAVSRLGAESTRVTADIRDNIAPQVSP